MKKIIYFLFLTWLNEASSAIFLHDTAHACKNLDKNVIQQKTEVCLEWGNSLLNSPDAPIDLIKEAAIANMFVAENIVKTNLPNGNKHFLQAWDLAQKSNDSFIITMVAANYGVMLNSNNQFSQTLKISPIAIKAAKEISQEPNKSFLTFRLMNNYADGLRLNKQFAEAKPIYQWLINASKRTLEPDVFAVLLNNWAICLEKTNELDKANAVYLEANKLVKDSSSANAEQIRQNYSGFLAENGLSTYQDKASFVSIVEGGIKLPEDILTGN